MNAELIKEFMVEMQRLKGVFRPGRGRLELKPYEVALLHSVLHRSEDGEKSFPSQIGNELGFTRSFVAQILTNLENLGYVTRTTQKDDRRMSEIVPTEKSLELFRNRHVGFYNKMSALLEQLGENDSRELLRLLRRMSVIMADLNTNDF